MSCLGSVVDYYLYPEVKESPFVYPTYNVGGVQCLLVTRADAVGWLVYCHGNAVTLGDLYSSGIAKSISDRCKCNFVAPAYPDDSTCTGLARDEQVVGAARAAYERICDDYGEPVWMAGRSLGVGVALAACSRRPPAGLMLLSGFSSVSEMTSWQALRCLIGERYNNTKAIATDGLKGVPKCIVHGTADTLVPPSHARTLCSCASDATLCMIDGMGHCPDDYWSDVYTAFAAFIGTGTDCQVQKASYPLWHC